MSRAAITVENLSKAYHIGLKEDRADTLVGAVQGLVRAPLKNFRRLARMNTFRHCDESDDIFWALRDVSFEVAEGEVVGIIGRNGAGKSTLLKILSRITEPTSGRAIIRGRVSSLLEVGTGFHQELTGRENVYMNGTILGMTRREIDRKFDEIVDFSGVEKFLDTPIKHYSSGMKVRLAFSVAAHLEPEILIIDEVLAVGDAEFQRKCLGKMQDVAECGRTVLFVSHNMPAVRSLTKSSLYLEGGRLIQQGETEEIIDVYLSRSVEIALNDEAQAINSFRRSASSSSQVRFRRISIDTNGGMNGGGLPKIRSGEPVALALDIESSIEQASACLSVTLSRNQEHRVLTLFSTDVGFSVPIHPGRQTIVCKIHGLPLSPGRYTVDCGVNKNANSVAYDVILNFPLFDVELPQLDSGELDWPHRPWGAVHWDQVKWQLC